MFVEQPLASPGFAKYRGSKMDDDFDISNKEMDKQEMSHLQYPSSEEQNQNQHLN